MPTASDLLPDAPNPLVRLLAERAVVLADGATGTNLFTMGLPPGHAPELWMTECPEPIAALHRAFTDAGSDIILTNTFGANRERLKLHDAAHRSRELSARAAELARGVADAAGRTVVVAGSVGPTGELFEPLGALTHERAVEAFAEQLVGLREGGADVAWIETMSAVEEVRAAATAAIEAGMPYVATCSFDTAGRTMMGLLPVDYASVFDSLPVAPLGYGANCGVGAPDIVVSVLEMHRSGSALPVVCKGNCGIPEFRGAEVHYSGTPELMARYACLAADAGARIVGGCCGTTPAHVAAMRAALDARVPAAAPTLDEVVGALGPLTNKAPTADDAAPRRPRRRA